MMPIKLGRELRGKLKEFANKFAEVELADKSAKIRKAAAKEAFTRLERLTVDFLEGLYTGYKGGKQKKWKVPKPEAIKQIVAEYYAKCKGGLGRVVDSPDNRSFWRTGVEATLEVATWPKWKRGGENAEDTPPERLKECRQELSLYDAMDYWTRIACTENLQYRPRIEKGCYTQPTCNYGFGCTTCWERYEVKMEEESRNHCD
jgi:hypothetical protein